MTADERREDALVMNRHVLVVTDPDGTGVWCCPLCGYVDPQTNATRCPKEHGAGMGRPLFEEIVYGGYAPEFLDPERRKGSSSPEEPDA